MVSPFLLVADRAQLDRLLPLVRDYHAFEEIERTDDERRKALAPLLGENPLGRIWLILEGGEPVGYIALCFGYSIEFGGRDAFVDEFFLAEAARGRGLGRQVLAEVRKSAAHHGIVALHLEVARSNTRARRFYEDLGFAARDRYHLMSCRV
jgi:ribosomal protein S18 acetylase RimI-like enzyme